MLKKSAILFLLILTGCSTTPSTPLTEVNKIDEKLLEAPVSPSLLVPCRVAYPLKRYAADGSLRAFYEVSIYNLGQVNKCYNKDEALIEEVKERDNVGQD